MMLRADDFQYFQVGFSVPFPSFLELLKHKNEKEKFYRIICSKKIMDITVLKAKN